MKINFLFFFFVGIFVSFQTKLFKKSDKKEDFEWIFIKDLKGNIIKYQNKTNLEENNSFSISICSNNNKFLKNFEKKQDYNQKLIMRMCKISKKSLHICKDLNEIDWEESKKLIIKPQKTKNHSVMELTLKMNSGISIKTMISYIKNEKNINYKTLIRKFLPKTLKEKLLCLELQLKDNIFTKKKEKTSHIKEKKELIDDMKQKSPIFKRNLKDRNIVNFFIFNLQGLKNEKQTKLIRKIMEIIYKRQ